MIIDDQSVFSWIWRDFWMKTIGCGTSTFAHIDIVFWRIFWPWFEVIESLLSHCDVMKCFWSFFGYFTRCDEIPTFFKGSVIHAVNKATKAPHGNTVMFLDLRPRLLKMEWWKAKWRQLRLCLADVAPLCSHTAHEQRVKWNATFPDRCRSTRIHWVLWPHLMRSRGVGRRPCCCVAAWISDYCFQSCHGLIEGGR